MPEMHFPEVFVDILARLLEERMDKFTVVKRPVKPMDPALTIGVFVQEWSPRLDSFEMTGQRGDPTLSTYTLRIQLMVKNFDEQVGKAIYVRESKVVRAILYRDPQIGVRLMGLSETLLGARETVMKLNVARQTFQSAENSMSEHIHLSATEVQIITDTVRVS